MTTTNRLRGDALGRNRPKIPESRPVPSVSVSVRECGICGKPLTGRQRGYCSDSHRAMASRKRREGTKSSPKPEVRDVANILGPREPAYSLIPKHRTTRGPAAVELMARSGLTLDEWQRDVLDGALGQSQGRWTAPETVLLAPRQNGKSECAVAAALWIAVSGPKKLVIISSHETKTNEELFLRMRDIVESPAFEEYAPRIYTANGRESITFSNHSRIKFIARSKHQGRGFSADLIVIDEAFILSDASWSSLKPAFRRHGSPCCGSSQALHTPIAAF